MKTKDAGPLLSQRASFVLPSRKLWFLGVTLLLPLACLWKVRALQSWLPRPVPEKAAQYGSAQKAGDWVLSIREEYSYRNPLIAQALNLKTGKYFEHLLGFYGPETVIYGYSISCDGKSLAWTTSELTRKSTSYLWYVGQQRPLRFPKHWWISTAFSSDGKWLYTLENSQVHIIDAITGRERRHFTLNSSSVRSDDQFVPETNTLLHLNQQVQGKTVNWQLTHFDLRTGQSKLVPLSSAHTHTLKFSPHGTFIFDDDQTHLWDSSTGKLLWSIRSHPVLDESKIEFSPDESMCVICDGQQFNFYATRSGQALRNLPLPPSHDLPNYWYFSPDGNSLFINLPDYFSNKAQFYDKNQIWQQRVR